MSFPLPPDFERAVLDRVGSGRYASAEDVLAAMVELLEAREAEGEEKLQELQRDIRVGLDQLDRGEGIPADQARRMMMKWREGEDAA